MFDAMRQNVSVTDADTAERAEVEYSLEFPWSGVDGFHVDRHTGVITAAKSFDRERDAAGPLRFLVVARDRGRPLSRSATATVEVSVVDVNDESPVFVDVSPGGRGYEFTVAEHLPAGTLVGRVRYVATCTCPLR